jgi:hypothetical protein
MATAQENGGGALAAAAGSAREFAEERLRGAGEPMAPAELADEYGCSSGHMRNVLRRMREDGEVGRPETGQYEVPPGEDVEVEPDGAAGDLPDPGAGADGDAGAEDPEGDADPSADGGPPSEGRGTEEEDGPSGRDAAIVGGATGAAAAVPAVLDEMDTRQMLLLLGVAVAVYFVFIRDGSDSSSGSETATSPADGSSEQDQQQSGGLVQ